MKKEIVKDSKGKPIVCAKNAVILGYWWVFNNQRKRFKEDVMMFFEVFLSFLALLAVGLFYPFMPFIRAFVIWNQAKKDVEREGGFDD
jgi:hypothetical protein